ncbi:MAG: hypothetical protein FWF52_00775 [Candidatus Azobacteroides sp.]|nr:hypothetical protein [Candidatus Azobacteroides sp.]
MIVVTGLLTGLWACTDADTNPVPPDNGTPVVAVDSGCSFQFPEPIPHPLAGTQWSLVGSIDAETGELTEYQHPKECNDCYSLDFDTDSTAIFRNYENQRIDLFHLNSCLVVAYVAMLYDPPLLPEVSDPKLIGAILYTVGSYVASEKELLLYYYFYYPYTANTDKPSLCYLYFKQKEI